MKDWLVEIIDQIALGEFLARSELSCGPRFGLIAVDNAVEYMLAAYVEVHKRLLGDDTGEIRHRQWIDTKSKFPKLLQFTVKREPALAPYELEISRYHDFRNTIYHSGKPITTAPGRVLAYAKLARDLIRVLFQYEITPAEWDEDLNRVAAIIRQVASV